jgi:hypothetical protein
MESTVRDLSMGTVSGAMAARPQNRAGALSGPRAALRKTLLSNCSQEERAAWVEKARLDALLGGMSRSMTSLRSGLRCYIAFVGALGVGIARHSMFLRDCALADACFPGTKKYFPPTLTALLAWSVLFRSGGTLRNYLGYVRTGCMVVGADTKAWHCCFHLRWVCSGSIMCKVFDAPELVKAKASVDKGQLFQKRDPLWIQRRVQRWRPSRSASCEYRCLIGARLNV